MSKQRDYDQVVDHKWNVAKKGEYFHLICCDCALTHSVEMKAEPNGDVRWRVWRNDRKTKSNRRKFSITAAKIG